jgi:hypothetical protein
MINMTDHTLNSIAFSEAQQVVKNFEETYQLSTDEMLKCAEHDERLARIDGFDLMDWHYALEQIRAFGNTLDSLSAVAGDSPSCSPYFYNRRRGSCELVNTRESELELVA